MPRALVQAKASEGKFPKRSFYEAVLSASTASANAAKPPVVVSIMRSSLHNGKLASMASFAADGSDNQRSLLTDATYTQMSAMAKEAEQAGAIAVAANVDAGNFRGAYEDLETLKQGTKLPVLCDDFLIYGYQLFRAKSCGADAIKVMASVLAPTDISYNIKIGKALGLAFVVVVSSKTQMLDVLQNVAGVEMISVTSRNMRLWKLDEGKAHRILSDPEVQEALGAVKKKRDAEGGKLLILQEGFSSKEEMVLAKKDGVDAVILGEELLFDNDKIDFSTILKKWLV